MRPFRNLSISNKLTLLTAVAVLLALSVACAILLVINIRRTHGSNIQRLEALGEVLATNSTAAISFGQADAARDLLESLRSQPTIQSACLIDNESNLFVTYSRDDSEVAFDVKSYRPGYRNIRDGFLEVVVPIEDMGEPLGMVYLRQSTEDLQAMIRTHLVVTAVVLCISTLFGICLSVPLQRVVSNPILKLAQNGTAYFQQPGLLGARAT